ncbi:hypothetical protein CYG49_03455 [Candidatus Saccharibacteria bacterium]|nr:MAG: hypothetical protein CYG49_03455 [Candidatus Saccharibacteria bacterium]
MNKLKKTWKQVPAIIRKPFVLLVGVPMIIAAPLLGWLPGPGGIPLFLLGIAILSTEFPWAEKVRDKVMNLLKWFFRYIKEYPVSGTLLILLVAGSFLIISYRLSQHILK